MLAYDYSLKTRRMDMPRANPAPEKDRFDPFYCIYFNEYNSIFYTLIPCPYCGGKNRNYPEEEHETRYCIFCGRSLKELPIPTILVKNCPTCDRDYLPDSFVFNHGLFCSRCGIQLVTKKRTLQNHSIDVIPLLKNLFGLKKMGQ